MYSTLILIGIIGLIHESIKEQKSSDQLKAIVKITTGGVSGLIREKIDKAVR